MNVLRNILVVEDEAGIRGNLREMLEAEGYMVREAVDGDDGIRQALASPPDLVICDVMMPGKDGWAVLSTLREREETFEVPFLFLTARADRESHRRGMELGAEDYLTKPFTRAEVLAAIEARLRRAEGLGRKLREQLAGLKQTLSRSLPHEILTPLNGILGLSAMLVDEYESMRRGEIHELAQGIVDSGENLHRLVRRFLLYSEMQLALSEPGQLARLRQERVPDASQEMERIARALLLSTSRATDLVVHGGEGRPGMLPAHFELCLQEMMLEALRRTKPGQALRLSCGPDGVGWSLRLQADGGRIEPVELERMRAGGGASDGMGLGLAALRVAADLYRGSFHMDSSPSTGIVLELVVQVAHT